MIIGKPNSVITFTVQSSPATGNVERETVSGLIQGTAQYAGEYYPKIEREKASDDGCGQVAQFGQVHRRKQERQQTARDRPGDQNRKPHRKNFKVAETKSPDSVTPTSGLIAAVNEREYAATAHAAGK